MPARRGRTQRAQALRRSVRRVVPRCGAWGLWPGPELARQPAHPRRRDLRSGLPNEIVFPGWFDAREQIVGWAQRKDGLNGATTGKMILRLNTWEQFERSR